MFSQRIGAQQQVLHITEITANFRQAGSRINLIYTAGCCIRTKLTDNRIQRSPAFTWRNAFCRFHKTSHRINRAVRRCYRAYLLRQRIGAQQQLLHVTKITTGFHETVDWQLWAQLPCARFRTQLFDKQIRTRQTTTTVATGKPPLADCFSKAARWVNRFFCRFFRTDRLRDRVGTADQVADVLQVACSFLQTSGKKGSRLFQSASDRALRVFLQHGWIKNALKIKGRGCIRAKLLNDQVLRQFKTCIFFIVFFTFIKAFIWI